MKKKISALAVIFIISVVVNGLFSVERECIELEKQSYEVYQNSTHLGSFSKEADAISEAKKWADSVITQNSNVIWKFENLYRVFQNRYHLGDFEDKDQAVAKALRWADSIIVQNGEVVWRFKDQSYKVSQNGVPLGIFNSEERAVAEALRWADSIIVRNGEVVWRFRDQSYKVSQNGVPLGIFSSEERAVAEALRWADSIIVRNGKVVWRFKDQSYKVSQNGVFLGNFTTKAAAIKEAKKWANSVVTQKSVEVWRFHREIKLGDNNVYIGQQESDILSMLGNPSRKDQSEKGFTWYVYNSDYEKYLQVGIKDGKVVSVYTNSKHLNYDNKVYFGMTKEALEKKYSSGIKLWDGKYEVYYEISLEGEALTVFIDKHEENKVTSVLLTKEGIDSLNSLKYSSEIKRGNELQLMDLANSVRVRYNLPAYRLSEKIAGVARDHSEDMSQNAFFSHENLKGESPFDRMERNGVEYSSAAENIAVGYRNAIYAHEAWMNSEGHRNAILSNIELFGAGIAQNERGYIYYTENFYTPR